MIALVAEPDSLINLALQKHTNLHNRGVHNDSFLVLRENNNLAVLVELGFITNQSDMSVILGEIHRAQVADAITKGLINYFDQ